MVNAAAQMGFPQTPKEVFPPSLMGCSWQRRQRFGWSAKWTLGETAHLRANGPVIACQDWVDGRQATRLL